MNIRRAQPGDIPALIRLLHQVGQVHHRIRPDIFRPAALKYSPVELEALLKDPVRPVFVAEEADRILGYCFCVIKDYTLSTVQTARRELYIDDLCVEESCRNRQVGTRLFDHACAFGTEQGCVFVSLNVWCGNDPAMAFYEHRGLTPRHIMMEYPLQDLPNGGCHAE